MSKIPIYSEAITTNWRACSNCGFGRCYKSNLKCRCRVAPKRMRKDRRVSSDGLCGSWKTTIPFWRGGEL